jgi:hypothetical protein
MLRSLNDLRNYAIHAKDGNLGTVYDFFFDDHEWVVRYLVVDTGNWLPGRKVLVAPASFSAAHWSLRRLDLDLTKEQIERSPPVAADEPVSRQLEARLSEHFAWPAYWQPHALGPIPVYARLNAGKQEAGGPEVRQGDPHLRSVREVTKYHIAAKDGAVGHVEDFIAEDETWTIRYIVVDTRNWLPGKRVLVAPTWIEAVKWGEGKVHVALSRETIKGSPKFDPTVPVNREYETRLYDYYGRPVYWE